MKATLTFLMILFTFSFFAQNRKSNTIQFYFNRMYYSNGMPEEIKTYDDVNKKDVLKSENIKTITTTHINKKGKSGNSTTSSYNRMGRIVSQQSKNSTKTYTYLHDTVQTKLEHTYKNKVYVNETVYENGKLTLVKNSKNGKVSNSEKYTYTSFGKIAHSEMTEKNKTYEMIYEYDEFEKLRCSAFLVNGKLKKSWNYSCVPEGSLVQAKESQLQSICKFEEQSNDGSYIIYSRSINKGKDFLRKDYFTSDSVIYLSESFENDSILTFRSKYSANENIFESFSKNGKRIYRSTLTFNAAKQLIERTYARKGKKFTKTTISYNKNGTIASIARENEKGSISQTKFEYMPF